jgi:hypothetical protein
MRRSARLQDHWKIPFSDDLKLWLKADAITGVAEGGAVASWPDSSGHLYNAVQATGALQPLLKNNVANGLAVVRFDGADDEMRLASGFFDFGDQWTLYIVAKLDSTGGASQSLVDVSNGTNTNTRFILFVETNVMKMHGVGGSIVEVVGTDLRNDKYAIHCAHCDGVTMSYFVNNVLVGSIAYSGNNAQSASAYALGVVTDNASYRFKGDMAEVLIYNRALTGAERRRVNRVMGNKYALGV